MITDVYISRVRWPHWDDGDCTGELHNYTVSKVHKVLYIWNSLSL